MDNKHLQQVERAFDKAFTAWTKVANRLVMGDEESCIARYFFSAGLQVAEKTLRDAVLDVVDEGDPANKRRWELDNDNEDFEDFVNAQRLDFADAVVARVRAIAGFDAKERGES